MGGQAIGAAIGAGSGLVSHADQQEQAAADAELAAMQTAYSPYLSYGNINPAFVGQLGPQGPSQFDLFLRGAAAGAQMGQDTNKGGSGKQTNSQTMAGQSNLYAGNIA